MIIVFYVVAIVGLSYFLFAKRCFDLFTLAFFSSCFYFLPGFVGFAGYPYRALLQPTALEEGTYFIMMAVLCAITISAIVTDSLRLNPMMTRTKSPVLHTFGPVVTVFGLVGLALTVVTVGGDLLSADKFGLLNKLNRWYLLWTTAATIGFAVTMVSRRYTYAAINLGMLLFDLFVGFRVNIVVAMLAVITLRLTEAGPQRLYQRWRAGLIVMFLGVALFTYKYMLVAIKLQNWDLVETQLRNPNALRTIFAYSEPFVTQGILNEVVRQDFHVGLAHLASCAYLLVPFAPELGARIEGFDSLFQPQLFSSVTDYGLGSNIWAEMISSGGWMLLIVFLLLYCICLWFGRYVLRRSSVELSSIAYVVLVYWAFYVHRNDLLYQLTLSRRVLMIGLAAGALCITYALGVAYNRRNGRPLKSPML